MRLFLKYGADPYATSNSGQGIFHHISDRLRICNVYKLGSAWLEEMTEMIVSLLQIGCDPNLRNIWGVTPSDMMNSTSSWTLWCQCLEKVGFDVAQLLQKDDEADGIEWLDNEIDERYETVVIEHGGLELNESEELEDLTTEGSSSRHRGSHRVWQWWLAPFFMFAAMHFEAAVDPCHIHARYHSDGRPCTNYVVKDMCEHSDHQDNQYPPIFSAREVSWRKHVAYRLWKNGLLGNAYEASNEWLKSTYPWLFIDWDQ
ncbi:uncharacterized protein BDZ99DRAFT_6421 [Mytilinidion resinicola]|uniref:Ankyrin n=1 Tax=Mytilinidion resinicola TaxID=574789 RepID=A0A6A6Z9N0_9PEZI|nr:uncharacterized protein BDZ99DRAFT_6421 [Mytilinidion resinicola]KAF2816985.1 hypothetical protein BDZ99DRAFT_6421 [Mytilinidion resinicola]